jgi:hypothetical protein
MMTLITKSGITAIVLGGLISSEIAVALDNTHLAGDEVAAMSVGVEAFKKIYAKPDLRHYTVELNRHGKDLDVTFVPDQPEKVNAKHPGLAGGSDNLWARDDLCRVS